MADSTVKGGHFDSPTALHVGGVSLLCKVVPEQDPYILHGDPSTVCVDVETWGHGFTGMFGV